MNWQSAVEGAVQALRYQLVDVERSAGGLLRVFIDRVPGHSYPTGESEFVTVDDCEQVTRHLQHVLEVENLAYERLEVSSPGVDRPLKREADYERFAGHEVNVTLKLAFQGRKNYRGILQRQAEGWRLVLQDGKEGQALDFRLEEVREARLVPVLDFKGRRSSKASAAPQAAAEGPDGGVER